MCVPQISNSRPRPLVPPCADLRYAALGFVVYTALFLVWIIIFQTQWQSWGALGINGLVWQPSAYQWWLY